MRAIGFVSLVLAPLAAPAAAQCGDTHAGNRHFVSGSGDLQCVIDHAVDGDVIILEASPPGSSFDGFVVNDKELTIIEAQGSTVRIVGGITVTGVDDQFHMRGIECSLAGGAPLEGFVLDDNTGILLFEDMTFAPDPATQVSPTVRIEGCDGVFFADCILLGRDAGVAPLPTSPTTACEITGSQVAFFECSVTGGAGQPSTVFTPGGDGAAAVVVGGGQVYLGSSTVTGGAGANGFAVGFCTDGGDGGDGLVLVGATAVAQGCASSFAGGAAGLAAGTCTAGSPGRAVVEASGASFEDYGGCHAKSISSSPAAPVGGVHSISFAVTGRPGDLVALAYNHQSLYGLIPDWLGVLGVLPHLQLGTVTLDGAGNGVVALGVLPSVMFAVPIHVQSMHVGPGPEYQLGPITSFTVL